MFSSLLIWFILWELHIDAAYSSIAHQFCYKYPPHVFIQLRKLFLCFIISMLSLNSFCRVFPMYLCINKYIFMITKKISGIKLIDNIETPFWFSMTSIGTYFMSEWHPSLHQDSSFCYIDKHPPSYFLLRDIYWFGITHPFDILSMELWKFNMKFCHLEIYFHGFCNPIGHCRCNSKIESCLCI